MWHQTAEQNRADTKALKAAALPGNVMPRELVGAFVTITSLENDQ